jgi:hypothetical protein
MEKEEQRKPIKGCTPAKRKMNPKDNHGLYPIKENVLFF